MYICTITINMCFCVFGMVSSVLMPEQGFSGGFIPQAFRRDTSVAVERRAHSFSPFFTTLNNLAMHAGGPYPVIVTFAGMSVMFSSKRRPALNPNEKRKMWAFLYCTLRVEGAIQTAHFRQLSYSRRVCCMVVSILKSAAILSLALLPMVLRPSGSSAKFCIARASS